MEYLVMWSPIKNLPLSGPSGRLTSHTSSIASRQRQWWRACPRSRDACRNSPAGPCPLRIPAHTGALPRRFCGAAPASQMGARHFWGKKGNRRSMASVEVGTPRSSRASSSTRIRISKVLGPYLVSRPVEIGGWASVRLSSSLDRWAFSEWNEGQRRRKGPLRKLGVAVA